MSFHSVYHLDGEKAISLTTEILQNLDTSCCWWCRSILTRSAQLIEYEGHIQDHQRWQKGKVSEYGDASPQRGPRQSAWWVAAGADLPVCPEVGQWLLSDNFFAANFVHKRLGYMIYVHSGSTCCPLEVHFAPDDLNFHLCSAYLKSWPYLASTMLSLNTSLMTRVTRPRAPSVNGVTLLKGKKVKVRTVDIAPLRSESPPQNRSGMPRVLKGFHSFTCTPTRSSAIGMSHTCLKGERSNYGPVS